MNGFASQIPPMRLPVYAGPANVYGQRQAVGAYTPVTTGFSTGTGMGGIDVTTGFSTGTGMGGMFDDTSNIPFLLLAFAAGYAAYCLWVRKK